MVSASTFFGVLIGIVLGVWVSLKLGLFKDVGKKNEFE